MSNKEDDGSNKELENECMSIESLSIEDDSDINQANVGAPEESSAASAFEKQTIPSLLDIDVKLPSPGGSSNKKDKSKNVKKDPPKLKGRFKGGIAGESQDFQLFVTRLAQEVTNQEIKEYFEVYGTVIDVTILNQAVICGFVKFSKFKSLTDLFTRSHVINGCAVEIHPNIYLRNECRRHMIQKN